MLVAEEVNTIEPHIFGCTGSREAPRRASELFRNMWTRGWNLPQAANMEACQNEMTKSKNIRKNLDRSSGRPRVTEF